MKIKDIALSAAYVGQMVVKAICVGAQEIWSAVKYIVFADPVVAQICATNFGDGTGLTEEDAAKVTSLGSVFKGNTEITSFDELAMFTGLTKTNNWEFSGCTNLSSISLPTSLATISTGTFNTCSSLTSIDIPNGVTTIGAQAFYDCKGLMQITIPPSVTSIDLGCFMYDTALTSVNLSEGLCTIGKNAFNASTSQKNLTIPSTVISIGEGAFYRAYIKNDIVIPSGVTTITTQAFAGNRFGKVTILGNITSIGNSAFIWCGSLKTVILQNTVTPPTLGTSVFTDTNAELAIYVPDQSVAAYREASGWLSYADKIKPLSQYVES